MHQDSQNDYDFCSVEKICDRETVLCYLIRAQKPPQKTSFLTPPSFPQQVGYIVYPAGGVIPAHVHKPIPRHLMGTSEVLLVQKGRCEIDIYNNARELVATRQLCAGDILIAVGGGHGFRMLEDTVFLEIKQGPYIGIDEKERF